MTIKRTNVDITDNGDTLSVLTTTLTKSDKQVQAQTALLVAQFSQFADEGGTVSITTPEQYDSSAELLHVIANHQDYIRDRHRDVKAKAYQLHRSICDLESSELKEPNRLETALKIARKRYRQLDEERQYQENERIKSEIQAAAERSVTEQAIELLQQGDEAQAHQLLAQVSSGEVQPVTAPPPQIIKAPKSEGLTVKKYKRFKVVNSQAIKRPYLEPNTKLIQGEVNLHGKGAEEIVGGIEVFFVESEARR